MSNNTVAAGLAQLGSTPSADTVMTQFESDTHQGWF